MQVSRNLQHSKNIVNFQLSQWPLNMSMVRIPVVWLPRGTYTRTKKPMMSYKLPGKPFTLIWTNQYSSHGKTSKFKNVVVSGPYDFFTCFNIERSNSKQVCCLWLQLGCTTRRLIIQLPGKLEVKPAKYAAKWRRLYGHEFTVPQ